MNGALQTLTWFGGEGSKISYFRFLSKCYKQWYIPDGLQIKVPIELDVEYHWLAKCSQIKTDCALQMIGVISRGVEEKCCNLKEEIELCTADLKERDGRLHEDAILHMADWKESEKRQVDQVKDRKWSNISGRKCKDNGDSQDFHTKWQKVDIPGDGNCFYRCISCHNYVSEKQHMQVSKEVIDHLEDQAARLRCYIDGDISNHIKEQRHADGRKSSWATEAEVIAAAYIYRTNIAVTIRLQNHPQWHVYKPFIHCLKNDSTIRLLLKMNILILWGEIRLLQQSHRNHCKFLEQTGLICRQRSRSIRRILVLKRQTLTTLGEMSLKDLRYQNQQKTLFLLEVAILTGHRERPGGFVRKRRRASLRPHKEVREGGVNQFLR